MSTRSALAFAVVYLGFVDGQSSRCEPSAAQYAKALKADQPIRADRFGDPLPPGAIARLGTVRFRSPAHQITSLQFSSDGQMLFSVDASDSGRLWQAATGKELFRFLLPDSRSWDISADGRLMAARTGEHAIRVSKTATGETVRNLTLRDHTFTLLHLSPDGKTAVAWATDKTRDQDFLRVWRLPGGEELRDIPITHRETEKDYGEEELFFVAEGRILVARMVEGKDLPARMDESKRVLFRRWNLETGQELASTSHRYRQDQKPSLTPDGKLLAVGFQDAKKGVTIRLVDATNGENRRELGPPMTGRLFGIRFSPEGRMVLAVTETDKGDAVRLWDASNGKPLPAPDLDTVYIQDVVFSPDGRTIAVLEEDTVHLCETATGKRLQRLNISYPFDDMRQTGYTPPKILPTRSVVAFSPDSKRLAVAPPWASLIRLWDVSTGKEIRPVPEGHERTVEAIAFAPDGKTVASVNSDGTVRLWEAATGRQLHVLPLATRGPIPALLCDVGSRRIAYSPDCRTIAAVSTLNAVQLWAVDTGAPRLQFFIPNGGIRDLLFSPDGKSLLTASHGRVLSWNARTGKVIHAPGVSMPADAKRTNEEDALSKVALSPDGRLLATVGERTGAHDGNGDEVHELRLWERATGKLRWRIPDDDGAKRIVERRQRFSRRRDRITRGVHLASFAPDGKTLAWNEGDAIELVDVVRGVPLRRFGSHPDDVSEIAFSPTDDLLAIAHRDGTICFVDPSTGTLRGSFDVPGDRLECIAFSSDGRTLATGGSDTSILLWDVRSILQAWPPRQEPPSAVELETLWHRLGSDKGSDAAEAMARLLDVPQQTVALLRQRLRRVTPVEARRVGRLLDDLASDDFEVRQRATKKLEGLGDLAEPFLRKRLAEAPPLETRRRLEALLEALEGFPNLPEQMRAERALEVLEHIGTAEARDLIRELASGAPEARLTQEAKASLARLSRRPARR